MSHLKSFLTLALATAWPVSLAAQSPGDRVRVTLDHPALHRVSGTLIRVGGDSLFLSIDSTLMGFASASVRKLEISRGTHRPIGRHAWYGALVGLIAGSALALSTGDNCSDCGAKGRGDVLAIGVSTAIGAVLGVAVGSVKVEDRWTPARKPRL